MHVVTRAPGRVRRRARAAPGDRRRPRRRAGRPALRRPRRRSAWRTSAGPEGFLARQVRRWTKQWDATRDRDRPGARRAGRPAGRDRAGEPAVGHRARRLPAGQLLLDPDGPGRISAVLDWEMSTLGDPLADLGHALRLLAAGRRGAARRPQSSVTSLPGFPTRARAGRALRRAHAASTSPRCTGTSRSPTSSSPRSSPASSPARPPARWRARTPPATPSGSTRAWSWDAPRSTTVRSDPAGRPLDSASSVPAARRSGESADELDPSPR